MKSNSEPVFYTSDKVIASFDFDEESLLFNFLMTGYYPIIPTIVILLSVISIYLVIKILIARIKGEKKKFNKRVYVCLTLLSIFFIADLYVQQSEELKAIEDFSKIYNSTL
jgi:predicted membrane channel-forming protein YqfA (hemolysin III family)